ncbi:hydroxylysine kinase-like [Protopterus annectens]|uniref:hydroxylysine kinase-like n=1 Tax=Protopterus annectens TaxID=7888 RepID=UPI001CF997C5|nr:hydroxylysine kinase-like [Protopterus annectens]
MNKLYFHTVRMDFETDAALSKSSLNCAQVTQLIEQIYGLHVLEVRALASYCDQNFCVRVQKNEIAQAETMEYVLKVMNSAGSQKNADLFEVQTQAMKFLNLRGFSSPMPFPAKNGRLLPLESIDYGVGNRKHLLRLLTFLPGTELKKVPVTSQILFEIGKTAALIDKVLQAEFRHSNIGCLNRGDYIWNLTNVPLLEKYVYVLGQSKEREVVEQVIQQFKEKIQPNLNQFRPCINHGDLNEENILLEPTSASDITNTQEDYRISGILDFDDMSYGYYVFEVAINIMFMMTDFKNPVSAGGFVLAGFESIIPLTSQERDAVFLLVNCRFSQIIVLNRYHALLCPDNKDYLLSSSKKEISNLIHLWNMGKQYVEKIWFGIADSYSIPNNL